MQSGSYVWFGVLQSPSHLSLCMLVLAICDRLGEGHMLHPGRRLEQSWWHLHRHRGWSRSCHSAGPVPDRLCDVAKSRIKTGCYQLRVSLAVMLAMKAHLQLAGGARADTVPAYCTHSRQLPHCTLIQTYI